MDNCRHFSNTVAAGLLWSERKYTLPENWELDPYSDRYSPHTHRIELTGNCVALNLVRFNDLPVLSEFM